MRSSTFNFAAAIFCAVALFLGSQETWVIWLNIFLALANLHIGLLLHKRGM